MIPIPKYSNIHINAFAEKEWKKIIPFLQKQFGLSEEDCKDVFQESFIVLHNNIILGKLNNLTSSLSTYFTGICVNKAREALRKNNKQIRVGDDGSLDFLNKDIKADKIESLLQLEHEEASITSRKETLVRQIVSNLPSPCNELLWGYFRDNLNMKTLAQMFNYSSESSVKVTKHRCQKKFKEHFNALITQLF